MALQVCNRCRKKRIKCDLQLPACKNCRVADAECFFWDDSLGQDIPCSYLHSLRQRAASLQAEIQDITDKGHSKLATLDESADSGQSKDQGYHLTLASNDEVPLPSSTAYLGPGSSARLLEHLLKATVHWHLSNDVRIPERLLPDESAQLARLRDTKPLPSFSMTFDQRKHEIHTLVPPSTQRAIIEHYLKIVSPEYPLLTTAHESALLGYENPLRWSSAHKSDPKALALYIVLAVSTALITRDLDPSLFSLSIRCREDVQRLTERVSSTAEEQIDTLQWACTAFCALGLCELIAPTSGQFWDIMGKATSTFEQLRDGYHFQSGAPDLSFRRLEHSLLKLESQASLHFRRPSQTCGLRLPLSLAVLSTQDTSPDEIALLACQHEIRSRLTTLPPPSAKYVENVIPLPLQIYSIESNISIASASLYTCLHPIFTSCDIWSFNLTNDPYLSQLLHIIAKSASTVIDHHAKLNDDNKIISLWIAAERIMECGSLWAFFLIRQRRQLPPTVNYRLANMPTRDAMAPILKVSTLLASFAARWPGCTAYVDSWETLVEMLWSML